MLVKARLKGQETAMMTTRAPPGLLASTDVSIFLGSERDLWQSERMQRALHARKLSKPTPKHCWPR